MKKQKLTQQNKQLLVKKYLEFHKKSVKMKGATPCGHGCGMA